MVTREQALAAARQIVAATEGDSAHGPATDLYRLVANTREEPAMGYRISHDGTQSTLSALQIENLGKEVKRAAGFTDWRTLKPLFAPRIDGYEEIDPKRAARFGAALLRSAAKMSDGWAEIARRIGQSAETAARANEPWVWS